MFVIDTVKYRATRHDISHVLSSTQYNTEYPGLLRNFVNDYYFDEITNWTLDCQQSYTKLCQMIQTFELVEQMSFNTYRHVTSDVDYIWVTNNNEITIIVEIGKRNVCYLKNIVKLHNDNYFPDLFILLPTLYLKILMPFEICEQELLNIPVNKHNIVYGFSYMPTNLTQLVLHRFSVQNSKWKKIYRNPSVKSIAVLCIDKYEWQRTINKFTLTYNMLSYNNLSLTLGVEKNEH